MLGVNRRNIPSNIRTANRGSVGEAAFNPDTRDWISRVNVAGGGSLHHNQVGLHKFVFNCYANGLRDVTNASHLIRYFLPINKSNSFTGCNVPLWAPSGVGNATLNNYVSGDWTSDGLAGNGSTKYADTGFNPSTHLATNSACLFLWISSLSLTATQERIGARNTSTAPRIAVYYSSTAYGGQSGDEAIAATGTTLQAGFTIVNRNSATYLETVNNTTVSTNTTNNGTVGMPSHNIYLAARNSEGSPDGYSNDRFRCIGMGLGLTTTQREALYSLLSNLG